MIQYDAGFWGIGLVCQLKGSVFPKALAWALPCAIMTGVLHTMIYDEYLSILSSSTAQGINMGVSGYIMVLGFILTFRTREAHSRWWESITLLQTSRGEWYGAYSNLLAFCSRDSAQAQAVENFQHSLVRLMSLLYGSALDEVTTIEGSRFEIFDLEGFDMDHREFFEEQTGKLDLVLQWIQQLVVNKHKEGVLDIAPPILSRVFQELSRGKVNITNAQKLKEFPFPFPYAQLLGQALLTYWFLSPLIMCVVCDNPWWACFITFTTNIFLWSINYVGEEIEEPFGFDANDLPLPQMQRSFNHSLMSLLKRQAQSPPSFRLDGSTRVLKVAEFGDAPAPPVARATLFREMAHMRSSVRKKPRGFSSSGIFDEVQSTASGAQQLVDFSPSGAPKYVVGSMSSILEDANEAENGHKPKDGNKNATVLEQKISPDATSTQANPGVREDSSLVGGVMQGMDPKAGNTISICPPLLQHPPIDQDAMSV